MSNEPYFMAFRALDKFKENKTLPPKFDKITGEGVLLSTQLDALANELQSEIEEAQRMLYEIADFEREWDKLK